MQHFTGPHGSVQEEPELLDEELTKTLVPQIPEVQIPIQQSEPLTQGIPTGIQLPEELELLVGKDMPPEELNTG